MEPLLSEKKVGKRGGANERAHKVWTLFIGLLQDAHKGDKECGEEEVRLVLAARWGGMIRI